MKSKAIFLAGFLALALGCHQNSDDPFEPSGDHTPSNIKGPVTIMVVPDNGEDVEEQSAKRGAEKAAADLGKTYGAQINIVWSPPAHESVDSQKEILLSAKAVHASAVLLNCVDSAKLDSTIDEVVSAQIPVMTFDKDAPRSTRFTYYGLDGYEAGQRLVRELSRQMKGEGKVAVLAGSTTEQDSVRATQGVVDEMAKNKGFNVLGVYHCDENEKAAMDEVRKQSALHPDIQGWVMVGPWALEQESFMKVLDPSNTRIVALSLLPSELYYVDKGATVYSKSAYQMAYVGVQTIVQKLATATPVQKTIKFDINASRVCRENVRSWAKYLDTWGFRDVPPKFIFRLSSDSGARRGG